MKLKEQMKLKETNEIKRNLCETLVDTRNTLPLFIYTFIHLQYKTLTKLYFVTFSMQLVRV